MMVEEDIEHAIVAAAREGDNRRLDVYATQFPEQFAARCADGLLEVAHDAKKPETVLYLMVKHHCVVHASRLETQDRELLGERRAQLSRSLEVLANAMRGNTSNEMHYEVRGLGCYDVSNVAQRAAEQKMHPHALSALTLQSAANGDLRGFIDFIRDEEQRGGFTVGTHSGTMLRNVEQNLEAIAAYAHTRERPTNDEPRGLN